MQLDCHPIPIDLMHNQVKHKVKHQNKRQGHWLNALGLALIQINVSELFDLSLLCRLLELWHLMI
jgi:hypothetical protein